MSGLRPSTIRKSIETVLTPDPQRSHDLATAAGVTYRQAVDALMFLLLAERVVRVGKRRHARWRAQTLEESVNAERLRANARRMAHEERHADFVLSQIRNVERS